jgi:hypothetical protein
MNEYGTALEETEELVRAMTGHALAATMTFLWLRFIFLLTGVGGILVMGLGIIISGVFILRVKPNARFVAAWIAFTAVVYAIGK